jgi:hypothetical protein
MRWRRLLTRLLLLWVLTFLGSMTDSNRVTVILNAIMSSGSAPVWPTSWHLRLMQTMGSNTANGTELSGATGYTTGGATMAAWTAGSGTAAAVSGPVAAVSWTNSGGGAWTAVAGIEIWDTAGTPLRWFQGALTGGSVTVNAGNTLQFAINSISLTGTAW